MTETEDKLAQQHLSRMAELFLNETDRESVMSAVRGLLNTAPCISARKFYDSLA